MKLTSSFSIKVVFISSQACDPNQFSLRITQLGLHYLLHPASETHLTQQPPVPVQIKTLYPELSKASFHLCICRSMVILWTGLLLTFLPLSSSATLSPRYTYPELKLLQSLNRSD